MANPYGYPDFVKSTGYGTVEGLCGANCYHDFYPFIPGISEPTYTPEELEELNRKENEPIEYNGKKYTKYEALQRQRRLETTMRAQRQEIKLLQDGGASEDDLINSRARYRGTSHEYSKFSEAMGLPQQRERVTIDGLGNIGQGKYTGGSGKESPIQVSPVGAKVTGKVTDEERRELLSRDKVDIHNSSIDKSAESGIIKSEGVKPVSINAIELPIEQKHTGKGNPNAVLTFGVDLNNRQKRLLNLLPEFDSKIIVSRKFVNMADLSALTAHTGHEFAMFTKGKERLIIRGSVSMVNIDVDMAKQLAEEGYKWSGHTHPGTDFNCLISSPGDKAVLKCFPQNTSVIYNSKGQYATFEKEE